MLALPFEAYESEVRLVLGGLLGDAGFNVDRDILAITVNRWPHGYAHEYLDLWDEDFAPGQAPHELARARFGNLTFANSDAGASAYTHTAIEEAFRAVNELRDLRS
jgi:spermidine dehydrogenase